MLKNRTDRSLATERGLWGDAYRELLRPRTVSIAVGSAALLTVAMTIFGPLGTLALGPLRRFGYWGLCGAVTFPACYALAAVVLYLTRHRSLIEMVPAVVAAVLLEGLICTAVVTAADHQYLPARATPLNQAQVYLTVTIVVAVCTFFTHYVMFLRIVHGGAAGAADPPAPGAESPAGREGAASHAANGSGPAPDAAAGWPATAPQDDLLPAPAPTAPAPVPERPTPQQARFYGRLSRSVSRDVIFLKVDDHYVDVHTSGGSCLILMRFADAVADLGDLGMQVHRSYWVAYRHMVTTVRSEGRTMLRVTGGRNVPISRPYLPAVHAALRAQP